jgi:DNA-binding CsgD family transcriptional regulator
MAATSKTLNPGGVVLQLDSKKYGEEHYKILRRLIRHRYRRGAEKPGIDHTDDTDHIVAIAYELWRKYPHYIAGAIAKAAVGRYWAEETQLRRMAPSQGEGYAGNHAQDIIYELIAKRSNKLPDLPRLPKNEAYVLVKLRKGHTLTEIADKMQLTVPRVHQIKESLFERIRSDDDYRPATVRELSKPSTQDTRHREYHPTHYPIGYSVPVEQSPRLPDDVLFGQMSDHMGPLYDTLSGTVR